METKPIFYQLGSVSHAHIMVVGTTGKGRSVLLEQEAKRRGISYEELERQMEPSEEQKQIMREAAQKRKEVQKAKELMMRNAIWSALSDEDASEIFENLSTVCGINNPTRDQAKIVFDSLDMDIIGDIVSWGMSDTPTRDSIWEFVNENKESLIETINSASAQIFHKL